MATRTALHLQCAKNSATTLLVDWLKSVHYTSDVVEIEQFDFPFKLYWEKFLVSEEPPTMLCIGQTQPDWVTVHYNSFYVVRDIAASISDKLQCLAIVAMMQSTADANYLSIFDRGEHLRTLECVAGEWKKQEGEPLSFETQPLGRNIALESEEAFYAFSEFEVETYCENFGLELWLEEASNWTVASVPNALSNNSMDVSAKQRLCLLACVLNFGLRVIGFAPRHLSPSPEQ